MKEFLKKILIFSAPLVLLSFFIDRVLNQVKRSVVHSYGEYQVWDDLYSAKANSDILIYGSSRAMVHIDPIPISDSFGMSAYNLGIDGHNFRLQNLRHELIMEHPQKPKIILHSLDMYTFEKRNDLYTADQFLPYLWLNTKMWNAISDYEGYEPIDHILPLVRYYGKTEAIMKAITCMVSGPEESVPLRKKGFLGVEQDWNDDLANARKKFVSYRVKLDKRSIEQFDKYLDDCTKRGIEVVLVYSPDYYEGHNFISNRDTVLNIYHDMASKYKIRFFNYTKDTMCLDKKWFYNSSHLNKIGAEAFTQKLIRDLKKETN